MTCSHRAHPVFSFAHCCATVPHAASRHGTYRKVGGKNNALGGRRVPFYAESRKPPLSALFAGRADTQIKSYIEELLRRKRKSNAQAALQSGVSSPQLDRDEAFYCADAVGFNYQSVESVRLVSCLRPPEHVSGSSMVGFAEPEQPTLIDVFLFNVLPKLSNIHQVPGILFRTRWLAKKEAREATRDRRRHLWR